MTMMAAADACTPMAGNAAMRVVLDTNGLYTTQAGVARYTRGLLRGFQQAQPSSLDLSTLAWEVENFSYAQPRRALKTAYREYLWAPWIAPRHLRRRRTDLLHIVSGCLITVPPSVRHVATLHDLGPLRFPERYRRGHSWIGRARRARLAQADRIICISRFTADEAMALLGLPAAKLEVVHNGCDFHPGEPAPVEETPTFDVPGEFFLFVGSLEPGKNLALLKAAYALAGARGHRLPPLLIVGSRWEGVPHEGPPPPGWHYLGRQPDPVLVHLYRRAVALLFPSKYEGFGLPVAEAMALGCPVICSRVASLPEVGGDAPLYAALEPAAYAEAMQTLVRDPALRRERVDRGRHQVKQFSWTRCAGETAAVYRQVHEGR